MLLVPRELLARQVRQDRRVLLVLLALLGQLELLVLLELLVQLEPLVLREQLEIVLLGLLVSTVRLDRQV